MNWLKRVLSNRLFMEYEDDIRKIFGVVIKVIEIYQLRGISSIDIYLKKLDELTVRKKNSDHPEMYDQVIEEIKRKISEMLKRKKIHSRSING